MVLKLTFDSRLFERLRGMLLVALIACRTAGWVVWAIWG
jgi:hypothetical protein